MVLILNDQSGFSEVVARVGRLLASAGVSHGALVSLPAGAKRVVLTDTDRVVCRVARVGDTTLCDPEVELAWAARAGEVVDVQGPAFPGVLADDAVTVTVWVWVPGGPPGDAAAFDHGAMLRRLHDGASPLAPPSPPVAQLATARARLAEMGASVQRATLEELLDTADVVVDAAATGAFVVCHGDAHDRNLVEDSGRLVLVDFDSATLGPRALDVASGLRAWSARGCGTEFLAGYGRCDEVDAETVAAFMWVRDLRGATTRAHRGEDVMDRLARLAATTPLTGWQ